MIPIVLQRVQRIAADVFSVPIAQISAESSADTIETWDSLQHLNFVLAVEQEFGVQFTGLDPYTPAEIAQWFEAVKATVHAEQGAGAVYMPAFEQSSSKRPTSM